MIRQHGFTLTELSLAVLILGITASAVIPEIIPADRPTATAAAHELAAASRFARQEALRTGTIYGVQIRSASDGYRIFRLDTATAPPTPIFDVYDPLTKRLWDVSFAQSAITSGVDISHNLLWSGTCNRADHVAFRADGIPACTDPMSVRLNALTVNATYRGHVQTISMQPLTGKVFGP